MSLRKNYHTFDHPLTELLYIFYSMQESYPQTLGYEEFAQLLCYNHGPLISYNYRRLKPDHS